jgi:hypothetical protein
MDETMCEVQESHLIKNLYIETILHNRVSFYNKYKTYLYCLSFSRQFFSLISQPPILPVSKDSERPWLLSRLASAHGCRLANRQHKRQ